MVAGKALANGSTREQPMVHGTALFDVHRKKQPMVDGTTLADGCTKEQLVHIGRGVAQDLPLTVRTDENNREIKE
jgi:hypothetical protein